MFVRSCGVKKPKRTFYCLLLTILLVLVVSCNEQTMQNAVPNTFAPPGWIQGHWTNTITASFNVSFSSDNIICTIDGTTIDFKETYRSAFFYDVQEQRTDDEYEITITHISGSSITYNFSNGIWGLSLTIISGDNSSAPYLGFGPYET